MAKNIAYIELHGYIPVYLEEILSIFWSLPPTHSEGKDSQVEADNLKFPTVIYYFVFIYTMVAFTTVKNKVGYWTDIKVAPTTVFVQCGT